MEAYKIGIDNYIKKPFLPEELHFYIQGLLKRLSINPQVNLMEDFIKIGIIHFSLKKQILVTPSQKIELSGKEAALLDVLFRNKGTLVSKDTIAKLVWGGTDYMNTQSLDVFLHNLRKYLSDDPHIKILTMRSLGYILEINQDVKG
jgi:DNA-binding response OmpR family regulator